MPAGGRQQAGRERTLPGVDSSCALQHDRGVSSPVEPVDERRRFEEQAIGALFGRRILTVVYWDVHNFGGQPRSWDYGDWHHAVMGVEIVTDAGPASVIWTSRFYPYGVEVFPTPISDHIGSGPEGPEGWTVTDHPYWRARTAGRVEKVSFFWERFTVGPARRWSGEIVGQAQEYDVPVAMRLDFPPGPVWMVAAMPQDAENERAFVGGDEILLVFTPERMAKIGFPAGSFLA
jgi:hypothetical protein